ncbi:MAG TPA: hypothetical protein VMU95_24215 [Trebonia sp.]|nr:hypothetical protein [Trebonia sp.]
MTSLPRSCAAGIASYLPSGRARMTRSAWAAAAAVVATAPGARTSVVSAIRDGSPDPAISTG